MILKIKNLSLSRKNKTILNSITLDLPKSGVIGLIGPNGCGKTTLLKCITNSICDYTGIISSKNNVISAHLNPDGFISYYSGFKNTDFFQEISETNPILQIENFDFLKTKFSKMSFGMKQMLGIINALNKQADIYLLDEPFNGLDLTHRLWLKDQLSKLSSQGKLIIITSHELKLIEEIVDHIVLLINGEIIISENKLVMNSNNIDLEHLVREKIYGTQSF